MSISDFVVAYTILRDLGKSWESFDAYKLGIIDAKGNKLKSPNTKEEKATYTSYLKIIFNLKRILNKTVGSSGLAHRAVSTLLLKENYDTVTINKLLNECGINTNNIIDETTDKELEQLLTLEAIHI